MNPNPFPPTSRLIVPFIAAIAVSVESMIRWYSEDSFLSFPADTSRQPH
jgi:hypothetical protein